MCSNTIEVIARITILPGCTLRLPCTASYLGDFPNVGGEGVSGRVFLVNRVTYAILCFNYENNNQNGNANKNAIIIIRTQTILFYGGISFFQMLFS